MHPASLARFEKDKHEFAGSAGELSAPGSARSPCTQEKHLPDYAPPPPKLLFAPGAVNFKKGEKI